MAVCRAARGGGSDGALTDATSGAAGGAADGAAGRLGNGAAVEGIAASASIEGWTEVTIGSGGSGDCGGSGDSGVTGRPDCGCFRSGDRGAFVRGVGGASRAG